MLPLYHLEGQKIAVFGLARSGLACARAAKKGGADVVVYDGNASAVEAAQSEGFIYADLSKDKAWEGVDQLIVSPGIPHLYPAQNPIIRKAMEQGIRVDNDISLFFQEIHESYQGAENPPRIFAITGSNGKSTTTALLFHALEALGYPAQMGGNIGRGVFDLNAPRKGEIYVLELSSYQTDLALTLTPDVAIFTNLSNDHLDRHAGMGGYLAAKARLFTQSLPRSIIGIEESEGLYLENRLQALGARVTPVSISGKPMGRKQFIHVKKGFLAEWNKGKQVGSIDLRQYSALPGAHNWQNIACVYGALRTLNRAPKDIEKAISSFGGLAHRSQVIGEKDGVVFVNDSKATNADATANALKSFENIHWIVGGRAKDGGIEMLKEFLPRVKQAYVIGEAADEFSTSLGDHPHQKTVTIEGALKAIKPNLEEGDVVLLSPAAASFDQYSDFEERGEDYISLVKSIFSL